MKIIVILSLILLSISHAKDINIFEYCKIKSTITSNIIVGKESKKFNYVYKNQLDYCLLFMRGITLKYPNKIFDKIMNQTSIYYADLKLSPEEFSKANDINSNITPVKLDITEYGYSSFYFTPALTLNDMKRNNCTEDTLSVFGIKLGCRYDYQKSIKVPSNSNVYNNKYNNTIIALPKDQTPYKDIAINIIPSTGEVSKVSLYLVDVKTDKSDITYKECIKISNDLAQKYHSKYNGALTLAESSSYGISGARLKTKKYDLHFGCTKENLNIFDFTDKNLNKRYKEEMELIEYDKNINQVF